MFTQNKVVSSNKTELANFIKDQDIFNSLLLEEMHKPGMTRYIYNVNSLILPSATNYRPDLVAIDFYGSEDYLGILLLQASPSLSSFKKGSRLSLLPKETIDEIITRL